MTESGDVEPAARGDRTARAALILAVAALSVAVAALGVSVAVWTDRTRAGVGEAGPGVTPTTSTPARDGAEVTTAPVTDTPTATTPVRPVFPDASSTGVPADIDLEPSDSLTITQPGEVVDGLHVTGTVTVEAPDVTIRNTRVVSDGRYPVRVRSTATNTLIERVEVERPRGSGIGIFITGDGTTVRHANVHSAEDGIRIQADDVLIEDSYIHGLKGEDDGHHDAIQIRNGDNIMIRGNNLQPYDASQDNPMNAAIQIGSLVGDDQISDLVVTGNLMNGGNYTINGGGRQEVDSARYADNWFGRDYRHGIVGNLQNSVWEDSNVWFDTGLPVQ